MGMKDTLKNMAKTVFGDGVINLYEHTVDYGTAAEVKASALDMITSLHASDEGRAVFFQGVDKLAGMTGHITAEGTDYKRLAIEVAKMPFDLQAGTNVQMFPDEISDKYRTESAARIIKLAPEYAAQEDAGPIVADTPFEKTAAFRREFALQALLSPTFKHDETSNELRDAAVDLINNYGKQDAFGASRLVIRYFGGDRLMFSDEINAKIHGPDTRGRDFR